MGTYSQPSLVLDTSLGAVSKGIADGTNKAIANIQNQNKTKNAQLEKSRKEQARLKKEYDKYQKSVIDDKNKTLKDINKNNLNIVGQVGSGFIGSDGSVPITPISKEDKALYNQIKSEGLNDIELLNRLEGANLDMGVYREVQDEYGDNLDKQMTQYTVALFGKLGGDSSPYVSLENYGDTKKLINTNMTQGLELISKIYTTASSLNSVDGPFSSTGIPNKVKKGTTGVPLYFSNDDNFSDLINIARDFAFGVNKGRYTYGVEGDEAYVDYKHDGETTRITNQTMDDAINQTGNGFISTTNKDSYNTYLKGLKDDSNINWKGVTVSNKVAGTDVDGNTITETTKIRDLQASKASLIRYVNDIVNESGVGSGNNTKNVPQNNWQMMGGPQEARVGDLKDISPNADLNGPKWTQEEIKQTYQWTNSYAQKERAKQQLYKDLEAKYMADNKISLTKNQKEKQIKVIDQDADNLFQGGIFIPESQVAFTRKYFPAPRRLSIEGDTEIGLYDVLSNYGRLKKDNFKGQIEFLNMFGSGKYASGEELGNENPVDVNGNPIIINKENIYIKSGNTWVERKDLQAKNNFIKELGRAGKIGTPTVVRKSLSLYKGDQSTVAPQVSPGVNPLSNQPTLPD